MAPSRSWRPSPLGALLCAVFLLATQALAASAVLGIDFGTEYIKAVLVKPGTPLEIVLTKDSRRKELATIAFKPASGAPKQGAHPERAYGSDAVALAPRFPADVYPNLKTLLGLTVDDEVVQDYTARHPALQLEAVPGRQTAAFKSKAFAEDEGPWTVEELLAMQLQSIQKNAEATAGADSSVKSLVITVPPFYTVEEKRAVQMAAELAGLKVLSLISDGVAVGLHYATSRQFPNINEGGKPEHHLVFDMGAGSTKATVMRFQSRSVKDVGRFNKTVQEVQVLATSWDRALGGDAFNALIIDDMVTQFVDSKGAKAATVTAEGIRSHGRAIAKLTKEAERLRQILSANANTQGSFEGLYEDVDFKYKITRADFEKMAEIHAAGVAKVVKDALKSAQLDASDLTSVILHGGASRTPFVQKVLEETIGSADKIRTNVNSDEAAVMGAGFRAAELSPGFRVKEIRISEGTGYSSGLRWAVPSGKEQHQRLWTAISPIGGPAKEITFANAEDFEMQFYQMIADKEVDVKTLKTLNLTATVTELKEKHGCAEGAVVLKAGLKLQEKDGEIAVTKLVAECETDGKEGFVGGVKNLFGFGKKDQVPLKDDEEGSSEEASDSSASSSSAASSAEPSAASAEASADAEPKSRVITIPVKYTIAKAGIAEPTARQLEQSKARLRAFNTSDKNRRIREEILNQLEAFTYSVRDLLDNRRFIAASTEEERTRLQENASEASEWLYGDGADASKDDIKKRLDDLKAIADPIQKRVKEADERPGLLVGLKQSLGQATTFIDSMQQQINEYDAWHSSSSAAAAASAAAESPDTAATPSPGDFDGLEDTEEEKTERTVEDIIKDHGPVPPLYTRADLEEIQKLHTETKTWLEGLEDQQDALPATADPVLLSKDLREKKEKLDKISLELALRGMRSFESKAKKMSKDEEARQKRTKTSKPKDKATETPKKQEKKKEKKPERDDEKDEL